MNKKLIKEIIKFCKNYRDKYSGRGMYGKTCYAIVADSTRDLINELFEVVDSPNVEEFDALQWLCTNFKEDDMGLSKVFYWTQISDD